eukprot:6138986-Pyramimonas_sp.AAC.1
MEWEWVAELPPDRACCFHSWQSDGHAQVPISSAAGYHVSELAQESTVKPRGTVIKLQVVQYNARCTTTRHTWGSLGRARRAPNKPTRLQTAQLGALSVGIQEARNPRGARCAD